MLRYIDKHGTEVSAGRWLQLSGMSTKCKHTGLSRSYQLIRQDTVRVGQSGYVETTWCGVVSSMEKRPGVFLVRHVVNGAQIRLAWCRDATEAEACHEKMLREIRGN
jgi:hypothetical protein